MIHLGDGPSIPSESTTRRSVYLPIVAGPLVGHDPPPEAAEFVHFLLNDERQERPLLRWCASLQQAAQWRCNDMAIKRYFAHCTPEGICPNQVARLHGCQLPAAYGDGNNIESLAAGSLDARIIFGSLANSPKHADHLFGRNDFFREQTGYAVGYVAAPRSQYSFYWCVLIGICHD